MALKERGYTPLLSPLTQIRYLSGPRLSIPKTSILIFTSANGVRAFCRRSGVRSRMVFGVGDATAQCALDAGFKTVMSAGGDGHDLISLVLKSAPKDLAFHHFGGEDLSVDIAAALSAQGRTSAYIPLYHVVPASVLPKAAADAIRRNKIDAALFHSRRSAEIFSETIAADDHRDIKKVCLSARIASVFDTGPPVFIAKHPDDSHLLDALGAALT